MGLIYMKPITTYYYVFIFQFCLLGFLFSDSQNHVSVNILDQDMNSVLVEYIITDYEINEINIKNEIYHKIDLYDEPDFLLKYSPELPHINRSFIIPDVSSINVSLVSSEYTEIEDINILPSKGNPKRNIDINTIPYVKGSIYTINDNFPGNIYEVHDPYILRDYRGQVLQINPFQYNPVSRVLEVYTRIVLRVDFDGQNHINAFENDRRESKKLVKDYHYLYSDRFINYSAYETRYNPIEEDGEMLVICYDSFCDEMSGFVDWKNQKGIVTTLVPKSEAGTILLKK